MIDNFRFWLSAELLHLSIILLPDERTKFWMNYGVNVAAEGMLKDLEGHGD